jgi:hypothetical protein
MLELAQTPTDEELEEQKRLERVAKKWNKQLSECKKSHEDYRETAYEAYSIYLNDHQLYEVYYPLLWSVVQVEHGACLSSRPRPDIRPRHSDQNPTYKTAAQVMERALEFFLDQTGSEDSLHQTVDDYLVAGLGVPRIKLDSEIIEVDRPELGTTEPVIQNQVVRIEHVPWSRFGWEPAQCWDHVEWVFFEHRMTVREIKAEYGQDVDIAENEDNEGDKSRDTRSRTGTEKELVSVYEIWDKKSKTVVIMTMGSLTPLDVMEDPLGLTGFFPIPCPIMTNVAYDNLIPTTDYTYMEPFDVELNRLYRRSKAVTEQIKAWGVHDASFFEMEDPSLVEDGDSIAIQNLSDRMDGGKMENIMSFAPIRERVETLREITAQIDIKRRHVDDIFGISDILRGSSNPQDGQDTNKIKERWAGIRLQRKQTAVQLMIRDLFRIMSEVTVEHVTAENLSKITQIQVTPEVYALLQNDLMREFAVDVETDSTVVQDENADKRERTELLQALTQYIQIVAPAMQSNMITADLGKEILSIAVSPYSTQSKQLETVIEQLPGQQQQLQQATQQNQQSQQQIQQLQQQIQQKDFALAQYSQADEARKNAESQAKVAKEQAATQKIQSELADQQVQAPETQADIRKTEAETRETEADTALKQKELATPIIPTIGPVNGI